MTSPLASLTRAAAAMVIPSGKASGMAGWRKSLFATMHLNANLPAAYFGVPAAQVVEVGLEVEI
jgi:KUP system potassium uptake protein